MLHFNFSHKSAVRELTVLIMLAVCSAYAGAQDAAITVTGLRDETSAKNIAGSVNIITADDIATSGKTNITSVLEDIPGISLSGTTGSTRRGVSVGGYGDNSYGRVLILLDGVPLNNPDMSAPDLSWIQISSIKQIEIVKGDGSALYGNQASAGVISITTKDAGKKSAFAEAGASTGKSVFGSAGVASAGDSYGAAVNATVYNERSRRENGDSYTGTAGAAGYYDVTDSLTVHTNIQAFNDRYGMPAYTLKRDSSAANDTKSYADDFGVFAMIRPEWSFSEKGKITVPVAYQYKNTESLMSSSYNYAAKVNRHVCTFRPDITYKLSDSFKIYGAADSEFTNIHSKTGSDASFDALDDDSYASEPHMKTWNIAPVVRLTCITGALQLEGTGRYDYYKVHYENSANADVSKSFASPVWQLSALYHVTDTDVFASSAYASFGSIFRYPFTDEMGNFYGYRTDDFNDLKAEKGYSARIGYKGVLKSADFDIYGGWSSTDNEIVYDASSYSNINMDPVNRWTAGISISVQPIEMVTLNAGYTYVNAKFTESAYDGNSVPLVSDHTVLAGCTVTPMRQISAGVSVRVDSPYYLATDFANAQDREPWSCDLSANTAFHVTDDVTLFMSGNNLLEKAKADYAGYSAVKGAYYYPHDGRSFTFKARITY